MITDCKQSYFKENSTNPRDLFTIIEKVLHRKAESALPEHPSQKVAFSIRVFTSVSEVENEKIIKQ